jgi:hypothetical protein
MARTHQSGGKDTPCLIIHAFITDIPQIPEGVEDIEPLSFLGNEQSRTACTVRVPKRSIALIQRVW